MAAESTVPQIVAGAELHVVHRCSMFCCKELDTSMCETAFGNGAWEEVLSIPKGNDSSSSHPIWRYACRRLSLRSPWNSSIMGLVPCRSSELLLSHSKRAKN